MPKKLHHQILKSINLKSSKLTDEIMHPRDAVSNWQRVTKNGTTGNVQKLNDAWNYIIYGHIDTISTNLGIDGQGF